MRETKHKPTNSPNTLSETYLLMTAFDSPVMLYTYEGGKKINIRHLRKYSIHGKAGKIIKKTDIMFALPASKLNDVKSGIRIQKSVKEQGLRTPVRIKDRPVAATYTELQKGKDRQVTVLMRRGHVLRGLLVWVSKYNG